MTTTERDEKAERLVPPWPAPSLHTVGRLDRDSEGLLLLTTDGRFTARVLEFDKACHKCYWALVRGNTVTEAALEHMRAGGLEIRGPITRPPVSVRLVASEEVEAMKLPAPPATGMDRSIHIGRNNDTTWIEVVLSEGRNRQVRKITATAGHKTIRLCRVAIGSFSLKSHSFHPGEWKYIQPDQVV